MRFFAYQEADGAHLLGDKPHQFQLFVLFISSSLEPQIDAARFARRIGQTSCIYMVLNRQGATASCISSWGHGNTSVCGGFTVIFVRKQLLSSKKDSRDGWKWRGKMIVRSHYMTHQHVLSWLMQHGGLSHHVPAVHQPLLTCMPSSHGVPLT